MASQDDHAYGCIGEQDDQDDQLNVPDQHTSERLVDLDPLAGSSTRRVTTAPAPKANSTAMLVTAERKTPSSTGTPAGTMDLEQKMIELERRKLNFEYQMKMKQFELEEKELALAMKGLRSDTSEASDLGRATRAEIEKAEEWLARGDCVGRACRTSDGNNWAPLSPVPAAPKPPPYKSPVSASNAHKVTGAREVQLLNEKSIPSVDASIQQGRAEWLQFYDRLGSSKMEHVDRVDTTRPAHTGSAALAELNSTGEWLLRNCSGGAAKASDGGNEARNSSLPGFNDATYAREVRFLEEKHALQASFEKAREELFMRHGRLDGERRESAVQSSGFRPSFGVGNLNQSQLSARQATTRDLPTFSGAVEEWPIFFASYVHSTLTCGYSDGENLLRLQKALKGKAREAVQHLILLPAGLVDAMHTLKSQFGRPELIIQSLIDKVRRMPAPSDEKLDTMASFGVAVRNMCATIRASGLEDYMCNLSLMQELVSKLPPTACYQWLAYKKQLKKATLTDFGNWVGELADDISTVAATLPKMKRDHTERHSTERHSRGQRTHGTGTTNHLHREFVNAHSITDSAHTATCSSCGGNCGNLANCSVFLAKTTSARWAFVKQHNHCWVCLNRHKKACRLTKTCGQDGCKQKHHKTLHEDAAPNDSSTVNCNVHLNVESNVLLRYVPVVLYGDGKVVNTIACLDDGSSSTFMEHSLLNELGRTGTPEPMCLQWTGYHRRTEPDSVRLALKVSGTHPEAKIHELSTVQTVKTLALPAQTMDFPKLAASFDHLRQLKATSYSNARPRILIGVDNCRLGQTTRGREGKAGQPIASKTRLGWIVYGPCSTMYKPGKEFFQGVHICICTEEGCNDINAAVREFFTIESLGISANAKTLLSKDDERALEIMNREVKLKGSFYETGLLWRYNNVTLPCSKAMALNRFGCLQRKMDRDPVLAEAIRAKVADYETKGYIRRLTEAERVQHHPRDWYLPIFPVINPNKPGKLRMVFDAAAKVKGVCLNSYLLKGPDQLTSLPAVLSKFREFRVAVAGDIREMFFQVRMKPEDQRSQMFLWGEEKDGSPGVYVVTVMTFGAACSPSIAQFVKNQNADRFEEELPRAVKCIKTEHYVDDMLASVETEDEAVTLAEQVRFIHAQGGFEIRNWISNSPKLVRHMLEDRSSEGNRVNMCSESQTEKVLGMWWDTVADAFTFRLSPKHDKELLSGARLPSKRELLRTLMSIYDPLGLIGNFLVYLKVLLQEVWRTGYGWDKAITDGIDEKWRNWISVLPEVLQVSVPRCYRSITSDRFDNVQVHIFCDASENAMSSVVYFRFEEHGVVECALAGSKTRVAPIKFQSIPRLELQAAVIGARLSCSILSYHRMKISKVCYWTDSRNVICWLNSDHRRYTQFVAYRIGEILETTDVNDWRWISTKDNVADEGTKWLRVPDLKSSSRWFRGPAFLWGSDEDWMTSTVEPGETLEEMRHACLHHSVLEAPINYERFSKWQRLIRACGYVLRFIHNARARNTGKPRYEGPLEQEELLRAEEKIIMLVQQEIFSEEIHLLSEAITEPSQMKRALPKSSPLYKLSPEVDAHGMLRMCGRLSNAPWIDENTKRPIIMPRGHRVTALLLYEFHHKYQHGNHQTAINEIRLKYYVPKIRVEYNRVRRSCQRCKNRDATPAPPAMGALPHARLAAFQRPFAYTGVDYFGPMTVAIGRRTEKRWGVIFTCLTTRAVHIEVAHTLGTSSCILAVRRFISKRGQPNEIISDCGTNFVGASRELKECLKQVDQNKLMEEFSAPNLSWKFNPPASPHFGGCWERLVRSIKKGILELKMPRLPTDEILQSTLAEIEMVINSRPLTFVPLDDASDPPLTPNHFLLGTSNGSKPPIPFVDSAAALKISWKTSQLLADTFWRKWVTDYLPMLTRRTKWFGVVRPIEEGDLVVIADGGLPRNCWPKGRVVAVVRAKDGQVRRATVQTERGLLERPATKLAVLEVQAKGADVATS